MLYCLEMLYKTWPETPREKTKAAVERKKVPFNRMKPGSNGGTRDGKRGRRELIVAAMKE